MSGMVYGSLPEMFKEELKPLDASAEKYVKEFMTETVGDTDGKLLSRIKQKPLMVDPIKKTKIKKPNRVNGLSARQKKELGLYKISKGEHKYEDFVPLNKLWIDYMTTLLGLKKLSTFNMKTIENKLLKADYHGAFLKVTKSKCSTYIGASGIVTKETKNMFYLITEDDDVKGIPKNNSSFEFQLCEYILEIFGSNFKFRSGERSARKFKTRPFLSF